MKKHTPQLVIIGIDIILVKLEFHVAKSLLVLSVKQALPFFLKALSISLIFAKGQSMI
jgi:hypothetical protein